MKALYKLNGIQFLAAINENYIKMLVTFFLLELTPDHKTPVILSITSSVFLIPFLLFSTPGGMLADKYPKSKIIQVTRIIELALTLLFTLAFVAKLDLLLYILLFLLATTSALFSPSKYSILSEIHPKTKIINANSLIASYTFLGIILGTSLASFNLEISHTNYLISVLFTVILACIQFLWSLFLPRTVAENPSRIIRFFFLNDLLSSLIEMKRIPKLLKATIAYAYFLFLGAFLQLIIIDFVVQEMGLLPLVGGYFFLVTSVGMAIGCQIAKLISPYKIKLMLIPYSGWFVSLFFLGFFFLPAWTWIVILLLLGSGIAGGIFLVPSQAYLLDKSPDNSRGINMGSANLLSFLFALLAPFFIYILNSKILLSPRSSFVIIGILNALFMFFFFHSFKDSKPIAF